MLAATHRLVRVPCDDALLDADLEGPTSARTLIVFAHGSGSNRNSLRNRAVATRLQEQGHATLLIDLLSREEAEEDAVTRHLRFDIGMLGDRLVSTVDWAMADPEVMGFPIGIFGASTGAAAALIAAARKPNAVRAVVSRGGRPDLAEPVLHEVRAETLLIVGGADGPVIGMNEFAFERLVQAEQKRLEIVPGAGHLFEEPGTMDRVVDLTLSWFERLKP